MITKQKQVLHLVNSSAFYLFPYIFIAYKELFICLADIWWK